jgi:predicted short-subunit dehydrogenase-like oxidoreductase (DUF2520 family)
MAVEGRGDKHAPAVKRQRSGRKPTVSIVGAGRLGTALACALATNGYTIEAVVARTFGHARRAAKLIGTRPLAISSKDLDRLPPSDILFITTPDDAIKDVAAELAAAIKSGRLKREMERRQTALHASGALSSDVLQGLRKRGLTTGSLHPLVSVSEPLQGAQSLSSAFFCVEGDAAAVRVARQIVRALGAQSFSISANDKALYHAAAVMASGHMTALFDLATEMLARCGLNQRRARAVFLPLLKSTLENLYTSDPAHALTGTFARADTATVRRHLTALCSQKMTDALAAYVTLGRRSLQLAQAAGANPASLKEIAVLLAESAKDKGSAKDKRGQPL